MAFRFKAIQPPPDLGHILRRSFFARGRIPYRSDKILPNGLAVAMFNLGRPHRLAKSDRPEDNESFAHSWLHGVQTTPLHNSPGGETHVLGLLFEPAGLQALLGRDTGELADRTVEADCVATGIARLLAPLIRPLIRRADGGQLVVLKTSINQNSNEGRPA